MRVYKQMMAKKGFFAHLLSFFLWAPILRADGLHPRLTTPPSRVQPELAQPVSGDVSIATWNVEWFPGLRPDEKSEEVKREHVQRVKALVEKVSPTILFLCEVRDLKVLDAFPYPYRVCTVFSRRADENPDFPLQSLALLSKVPWKEVWSLDFSDLALTPDRPPRGILGVSFKRPDGSLLTLYGVHFKSNRGDQGKDQLKRERALQFLLQDFKRRRLDPMRDAIIVLGDFNTSSIEPTFREETTLSTLFGMGFCSVMEGMEQALAATYFDRENIVQPADFDHILISRPLQADFKKQAPWGQIYKVPQDDSDHAMVFLEVPGQWFLTKTK
jgi:endonuclease/exonuclease/phosphatase family metal-dependent hydrolase